MAAAMATAQFCGVQRTAQLQTPSVRKAMLAAPRRQRRAAAMIKPVASAQLALAKTSKDDVETKYLENRATGVTTHFPGALGVDDAMQRLEIALFNKGFTNENSIACINLCRDEITQILKHKIDQVFGSSFNTNGLGGVLTCGVTGVGAGLSHSPVDESSGKERYVFFSFPHIAIDSAGVVGNVSRPGRSAMSCACGALIKSLGEIKSEGLECNCKQPGVHEPLDCEYSILKQRLARRMKAEGQTEDSVKAMDLVGLTKVAERTITADLELLISKAVDVNKADYAVVTGVQIHNWATQFDDDEPNLEFVWITNVYTVVNGEKTVVDLNAMPGLTPRQIRLLASAPDAHTPNPADAESMVCNTGGTSTLREIDPPYMYSNRQARQLQKQRLESFGNMVQQKALN